MDTKKSAAVKARHFSIYFLHTKYGLQEVNYHIFTVNPDIGFLTFAVKCAIMQRLMLNIARKCLN